MNSGKKALNNFSGIIFAFVLVISSATAFAQPDNKGSDFEYKEKIELRLVLGLFLKAVENGGLTLFDQIVTREMLVPVQIAHVYELESDKISINIFCQLKAPMKVPHHDKAFYVDGITAYISPEGEVYEITAHVKPY